MTIDHLTSGGLGGMQCGETWLRWLKHRHRSKFIGVQHLQIFEVFIEVTTTVEAATTL
jgi:hypothetical protein